MDSKVTIEKLQRLLAEREAELQTCADTLAHEIAGHRQTEAALHESEEQFRRIVENSHDVVYAVRPDGIVTYMSPHSSYYGYSPDEIISKHVLEFIAPEHRRQVIESFESVKR